MALYDHRVFRVKDQWWVAQVRGGVGAGGGPVAIDTETVTFTCISDEMLNSFVASVPPGRFRKATYRRLVDLLRAAKRLNHRSELAPVNPPWREEREDDDEFTDSDGLRWVIRPYRMVQDHADAPPSSRDAVEIICLDDSGMRGVVGLATPDVYDNAREMATFNIDEELVALIKSNYDDRPLIRIDDSS